MHSAQQVPSNPESESTQFLAEATSLTIPPRSCHDMAVTPTYVKRLHSYASLDNQVYEQSSLSTILLIAVERATQVPSDSESSREQVQ